MNKGTGTKSYGGFIAIAIVAVLVIIGALYFWSGKASMEAAPVSTEQPAVAPVSSSDDVGSIEADLKATSSSPNMSGLDSI